MKPNNKINYDIQFNKFKSTPLLNDSEIPPFENVVKAQKIWLKKTRLQMIIRYSLSCIAVITIAFVGFHLLRNKPQQNPISKSENKVILKDTSVIKAPVKEWDIAYQKFKINADSLTLIKMPSGTSLTIQPNSIADSLGNLVKGEVDIECREFFDPIDIMVAGIPMKYDSAGTSYTLETAGMIEINGSQNNQKLKIAEGKSISIAQMSFGGNDYNTYSLDTKTGKWTYQGRPENKAIEAAKKVYEKDETVNSGFPTQITIKEPMENYITPKLNTPKLQNESNPCFRLDVDKNTFPELAIYNNVLFEVKPGQGFNSTNEYWDKIDLKPGIRPNEYIINLYDMGNKITAVVSPVFKKGEDYKEALAIFKKYEKKELSKVEEFKKNLNETKRNLEKLNENQRKKLFEEQTKNRKEALDYGTVVRTFTASEFGYWNTDRPHDFISPKSKTVRIVLDDSKLTFSQLFQIEKNTNTLMVNYNFSINTYNIRFNPNANNLWFVVVPGSKKIAILTPKEFSNQIANNDGELSFKICDKEFNNADELKEFILGRSPKKQD